MDPLPLIPENFAIHDVTFTLTGAFQNTLKGDTYPYDIARNIVRNDVDDELKLKKNANQVLQIYVNTQGTLQRIQDAGNDIMDQKGLYMIKKDVIRKNFEIRERLKLKRCDLFKTLKKASVDEFGLIQGSDLLPEIVRQYLDFRYYKSTSHICAECSRKESSDKINQKKKRKQKTISEDTDIKTEQSSRDILKIIPEKIKFYNYELGQTSTKKIKIINTSTSMQSVSLKKHPNLPCFSINLDQNSKLAPGMSVSGVINFQPEIYRNYEDETIFKNGQGDTFILPLKCSRDVPRLISYVLKPNANLLEQSKPGNTNFLEERRKALNFTIDCGSCLVSQYNLVSIVMENKGAVGKFFIITEDEWFQRDIQAVTNCMELLVGDIWVYPTFFEVNTDELIEMNVIFQPTRPGLQVETLYLICDNNSFEQLEIMGDALEFSNNFIRIDVLPRDVNISEIVDYCIYFGNTENNSKKNFTLTVHNKSSIYLDCLWKFRNKTYAGVYDMEENWITQKNQNKSLIPYSTADFNFEISLNATTSGYHSIFISLLILNIPLASLCENEKFILIESSDISGITLSNATDVQITEFEIACFIDLPAPIKQRMVCENCTCTPYQPKLVFSTYFLSFGIIPTGLSIQKELYVQSNTDEHLHWVILEVKYNLDTSPHSEVLRKENLSCSSGEFLNNCERTCLNYSVNSKIPISWVSILVLISIKDKENSKIESICVVTYEVIDYDIVIKTDHATATILCPLKLIYVGIPVDLTFTIENRSPITGCFYFLKPTGRDSDNISIQFTPNSSVIDAFETMEISVKLRCSEIGIFENLYVPCFVGKGQEPIMLRVLCAVDGVHVAFYLPDSINGFRRFIWPPKVVYEYDNDWGYCKCEQEDCLEYPHSFDKMSSKMTEYLTETCLEDATEQKSSSGTLDSEMNAKRLELILRDQFKDDVFLNEEIVEMHDVPLRTPKKLTIYIENITPIVTSYTIQVQNFCGRNISEISMINMKLKKEDDCWNDFVSKEYGILVQPELESEPIAAFDSIAINIWIYANTYGIYSEEIVIDIPEVPALSFSLLIEVVGSPIVFPMALNSITENPIIRFGSSSYGSKAIRRKITISNTSCIPLHIIWHTFMSTSQDCDDNNKINVCFDVVDYDYSPSRGTFTMFDEYLGKNTNEYCGIESKETDIEPNSNTSIELFLKPHRLIRYTQKMDLNCHIIGHIYLMDYYRYNKQFDCRDFSCASPLTSL